jgi:diguanylate cyclase (GGDEF)-like protein
MFTGRRRAGGAQEAFLTLDAPPLLFFPAVQRRLELVSTLAAACAVNGRNGAPGECPKESGYVSEPLRLLFVEDVDAEAELAVCQLKAAGLSFSWKRVAHENEFREALQNWDPDLVLCDFTLPGFDGSTALRIATAEAPGLPFIFLSGTIGDRRAIDGLLSGAMDYVPKSDLARLAPAIVRALEAAEFRSAYRRAESRVAHLTRVLQMLSGINTAVVRITERDALLREACRLAHGIGGYSFAFVALLEPDGQVARPVAWAGEFVESLRDAVIPVTGSDAADFSVTAQVLRTGKAMLSDAAAGVASADSSSGVAPSARSFACLPLKVAATPVGAMMFGAPTGSDIAQEELRLLEEVATNLSIALQYLDKQNAVRFLSYFDPLTGLAKRPLFCERLGRLLAEPGGAALNPTVVVLDVEQLSALNDSFGRQTGDLLLQNVADRLTHCFGHSDYSAHLGGGTFAGVFANADEPAELRQMQARLAELFEEPFLLDGRPVPVRVKSGLATYPENGDNAETLVQNAEAALKVAKSAGEQTLRHQPAMNVALAERLATEHRLRTALANQQFVLHYQPKIALGTGRITGAEALLRWVDPERGVVGPASFLSVLESTGLIIAVGEWALTQVAADCHRWWTLGLPPVRVAVNAAPAQLRRRDFGAKALDAAVSLPADAGWGLDIEITEGALLSDFSWTRRTLRVLRSAGLRVAIDDFGTGYSSLSRLSQLPVDTLKIDRSFTSKVPGDAAGCTLVATIIGLARAFNMSTVAEGVETDAQLAFLERAGCDESQGYLHSRPVPAADFERLLAQRAAATPALARVADCDDGTIRPQAMAK